MKYVIGGVHLTVRLPIHSKPGIEGILTLSIDWAGVINSHVTCHLTPLSHLEDKIILKIMASSTYKETSPLYLLQATLKPVSIDGDQFSSLPSPIWHTLLQVFLVILFKP